MSPRFPKYSVRAFFVALAPFSFAVVARAQAPAPAASSTPPSTEGAAPAAAPAETPPADSDVTMDAEATPAPTPGTAAPPAPAPSTTPPPAPPATGVRATATPTARPGPAPDGHPAATPQADASKRSEKDPSPLGVLGTGIVVSGYFQGQYESHQDSSDQLRQGGGLLNQNRFLLRRGRIRLARDWDYAAVLIELDGNTNRGPTMRIQKAELSLVYGRSKEKGVPPIAQLTIGQFDLPFGFDLVQSPRTRWFTERSTVSRALWPGEPDMGARFSGGISFARYAFSVTNGEPIDEKSGFGLQDPNGNKDITGRLGAEAKAGDTFVVSGGVSYNRGKGFHPGTDATKSTTSWSDLNGNGMVDVGEISGTSPQAAVPSLSFSRWAVGADLELQLKTLLGWSSLTGEVISASNLDRNAFIADPLATNPIMGDPGTGTANLRELGWYIGFTQEITPYGVVGIRYDVYDPNSDSTDTRGGKLLPKSQTIRTVSPLVGLSLPDRARLVFQYDHISDFLARDTRGVPTDFKNDQWTLRLQVTL